MVGTMQIAKTLVSWPVIGGVDDSAPQIQNDSKGLHSQVLSQVLSAVCCIVSAHYVYFCRCIR